VIDHSGSMGGEKMEMVKNTFRYLLHFLNDQDRLSIVTFDDQVSTLVPLMNTTKQNKDQILSAVSTVQARGGTIINGGFKAAIDILNQREISIKSQESFYFLMGLIIKEIPLPTKESSKLSKNQDYKTEVLLSTLSASEEIMILNS